MEELGPILDGLVSSFQKPLNSEKAVSALTLGLAKVKQVEKRVNHDITVDERRAKLACGTEPRAFLEQTQQNQQLLESSIVRHLLHNNMESTARQLIRESPHLKEQDLNIEDYRKLYGILAALNANNIDPALEWAYEKLDFLKKMGSPLISDLRALKVANLVKSDRFEAIRYMRTSSIQSIGAAAGLSRSVGCPKVQGLELVLVGAKPLNTSVHKARKSLEWAYFSCLGESPISQLALAVHAGSISVAPLERSYSLRSTLSSDWSQPQELSVEVDLPKELQFHPIFVCPVSKEQTTPENPPCLLPCGHVLASTTVHSLRESSLTRKVFKCPYCPETTNIAQVIQITI